MQQPSGNTKDAEDDATAVGDEDDDEDMIMMRMILLVYLLGRFQDHNILNWRVC